MCVREAVQALVFEYWNADSHKVIFCQQFDQFHHSPSRRCSSHESSSGMAGAHREQMKTVIEIQGEEFEREIRLASLPVLAHFRTSWCGQCRILAPSLVALADALEAELRVATADLDHCPELARRYGITDVPTLILFDTGAPIARLDAWMPPRQMRAQLQGLLADHAMNNGR